MSPNDSHEDSPDANGFDFSGRIRTINTELGQSGLDALLVTDPVNIRYLTGFAGSAGLVLVSRGGALLVTDDRYGDVAADLAYDVGDALDVYVGAPPAQRESIRDHSRDLDRVGLEADHVTWDQSRRYRSSWFDDSEVVATEGVIALLRLIKEPAEVECIEAAAIITDDALAAVRESLASNLSERAFQLLLDREIIDRGAEDLSFSTIVASGPNSARPHHVPGDRVIGPGDLVVVDVGALVSGYHSDMTRTFCVGEPDEESIRILDVVTAAQEAGVLAVRPGVSGAEVDRVARAVIDSAGMGEEFVHGVGHGVGLLIHEQPIMGDSEVPLRVGQVVTIEPGVYRSGFGGVRVEDTVVVTEDGCRPLTHSPKDPFVV